MPQFKRPVSGECAEYFEGYLNDLAVDGVDVLVTLQKQADQIVKGLGRISEQEACFAYAPGKWTVKEIVGHLIDMERLFAFRSLWIARGATAEQPSVDENLWAANSNAGTRTTEDLADEYHGMRTSHLQLFQNLDESALPLRGLVGGFATTLNSVPWLMAAHEIHHLRVLKDRYGVDFL